MLDLLFELKYVKPGMLGMTGKELRRMDRKELEELDPVKRCLADAEAQLRRYRDALERRYGAALRLRAYSVVALGFERLVARELVS